MNTPSVDPSWADMAQYFAPDFYTMDQWKARFGGGLAYLKTPEMQLAVLGVLRSCIDDLKSNKLKDRLRWISEIRWWISDRGEREALYKFGRVVEAMEVLMPEITAEAVRERLLAACERSEEDALEKLGWKENPWDANKHGEG